MTRRNLRCTTLWMSMVLGLNLASCVDAPINLKDLSTPILADNGLSLELVSYDPQIVTPIGIAIDEQDDLYVLESHTHSPESNYEGPSYDRIMKSVDQNQDGKPDSWTIFADSISDGMNLKYFQQALYLVTKNQVEVFRDNNHDHLSDDRQIILSLQTPSPVYDHAGLLGIEISQDGWIYISRGNIGGQRYQILGSDSSVIRNFGDGGHVIRCRLDGGHLEEIATGFWNPFDLKFSASGKLWLTDNDPDSRGPNRLLQIVHGADYGYKSLYGGSGIHPFVSWNGELPGTLPYFAGIGEAPSGLLDATLSNLGNNYANKLLIAIWEENKIITVDAISGAEAVLIQGDSSFHPVSMAVNSKGDIYFTDWVIRQYPNHGKGRIWRLSGDHQIAMQKNPAMIQRHQSIMENIDENLPIDRLKSILLQGHLLEKSVARSMLKKDQYRHHLEEWLKSKNPELRLEAILILSLTDQEIPQNILSSLIFDDNESIRNVAMQYVAKNSRLELSSDLHRALQRGKISASNFETFLATLNHLEPEFIHALAIAENRNHPGFTKKLDDDFIFSILKSEKLSVEIRSVATSFLTDPSKYQDAILDLLVQVSNEALKLALIDCLKRLNGSEVSGALLLLAQDDNASELVRTKAVVALGHQSQDHSAAVSRLLGVVPGRTAEAMIRYLCQRQNNTIVQKAVEDHLKQNSAEPNRRAIWKLCNSENDDSSLANPDHGLDYSDGSIDRGHLIFELVQTQCQRCHKINHVGGNFGPDLSHIGSSKSVNQLALAILDPSAEIAPEWQGWIVVDSTGKSHLGWQIDVGRHHVKLMDESGEFITYHQVKHYAPMEFSLMPEGLEKNMTEQDFVDLVVYLSSLK